MIENINFISGKKTKEKKNSHPFSILNTSLKELYVYSKWNVLFNMVSNKLQKSIVLYTFQGSLEVYLSESQKTLPTSQNLC